MCIELRDFGHATADAFLEFRPQPWIDRLFQPLAHFGDCGRIPKHMFGAVVAINGLPSAQTLINKTFRRVRSLLHNVQPLLMHEKLLTVALRKSTHQFSLFDNFSFQSHFHFHRCSAGRKVQLLA